MNKHSQQGVVSLIAVLGVGLFAFGGALTLSLLTMNGLVQNRHTIKGDQAFYSAEAGMNEGVYQYLGNSDYAGGVLELLNGTDSGTITIEPIGVRYIKVSGNALSGETNRIVVTVIDLFPGGLFEYGLFGGDDITASGNSTIEGNIIANDDVSLTGSSSVEGNASSVDTFDGASNVTGTAACGACGDDVSPVTPPTIDTDTYRQAAIDAGTYFTDIDDAEDYLEGNTVSAVVFVENDGTLQLSTAELTGSLYVTGNLDIGGNSAITGSDGFAAVVVEKDLLLTGDVQIHGVVYVFNNVTFNASGDSLLEGALISLKTVELKGNSTLIYNPDLVAEWAASASEPAEGEEETAPIIVSWDEE